MSNAIDNAKMHGLAKGEIFLYVDYDGALMFTLINKPGNNHQDAIEMQAALGTGFMFKQQVNLPGSARSTFLVSLPLFCLRSFLMDISNICRRAWGK